MTYLQKLIRFFSVIVVLGGIGYATSANAQATRTWVSGVGDDVNPCSRTAPCKTFAGAISKTAPGGEINCLDPAGFGAVTLTKSITIDCTGTLGGILASSTTGVILNGAGIIVNLRGLEINGGPPNLPGVNGIRFLQGARLSVEDCTIYNFLGAAPNGFGIIANNTSTTVQIVVRNSVIRNNGTAVSGGGIALLPTGTGSAKLTLNDVQISGHFRGVDINAAGTSSASGVAAMIQNTTFAANTNGLHVNSAAGPAPVQVIVKDSTFSANTGTAINGQGSANTVVAVSNTSIFGNGTGVNAVGGASVLTFGDNLLSLNGSNGTFSGPAGKT
jgi:hypothetical protein